MYNQASAARLLEKTVLNAIQVELQEGYNLSAVEAQVLAQRLEQLVDEQAGWARQPGQITYQAIAVDAPAGEPLKACQKVPVHLTLVAETDGQVLVAEGPEALRRLRVQRITYEALLQGGVLSQEDLACILGLSLRTVKRIFAHFREQDQPLPSRGEIRDMGRGVSHKIPVIRRYLQDFSFSRISQELGKHGIGSMARYLRHFALVMILEDRGLSAQQMQSIIGTSVNLIEQYRALYAELNVPEYALTLARLKQVVFHAPAHLRDGNADRPSAVTGSQGKGGWS